MNKLFIAAILLFVSFNLSFSFERRKDKNTLSLESSHYYNYDSTEIKGVVTINNPPRINNRMPLANAKC